LLLALLPGCSTDHGADDGHAEDDVHGEDHAGEEESIELTEQQFRSAAIEVAEVRGGRISEVLTLPGTVAPNADAVLHVTPRVSGQVRTVLKHLGEPVQTGELLCVIDSVELGDAVAGYLRDKELTGAAEETLARARELYSARPHELDLNLSENGKPTVRARVQRVQTAGALVRIEVLGDGGETINVEMPHERFQTVGLRKGDVVFVSLKDARVFFEDYSI
jgi:multidrug efflux pump subunit AcrA (membrane-fusion protein)